ncbi:uncharacterized protein PGTG_18089 [Puccinia graminis f. sp. tritici CRL 75-36-700-3]|uniref:Uncharacterized protein n=1 Tax=Puccinia graminis f. sp. tritici (strain CRL 75-36-700-3 / race SCCL) TaxID=418459 RepID=E3L6L7_PUCGT|nr:uncharacterized protein PGTG_18089 [Puccinia graminis f. sp. tritici CRL 75-36-700-3]EFP92192.2 hypothetical protein PGTG_18089 [Puccinia graminis f. sp. tritici CRL 75-36-700-3]
MPNQKLSHTPEFEIPQATEAVSAPGSPHPTETRQRLMTPTKDTGNFEEKPVVAPTKESAKERKNSLKKQVCCSRCIFDQSHRDGSFATSAGYCLKNDGHQEGSWSKRQRN